MNKIGYFIILMVLGSCGFRNVRVQIHQDPVVKLTPDVRKIAVVNLVKNNSAKKVGSLVLGEIPSNDEKWSAQFIQTCSQRIGLSATSMNRTLSMSVVPYQSNEKSTMFYQFSKPLEWYEVDSICKNNNAQGLLTVDYFGATYDMNVVSGALTNLSTLGLNAMNPTSNGTLRGQAGFRYYDLKSKMVLQKPIEYYHYFGQSNNSRRVYIQNVPVSTLLTGEAYRYVAEDMGEFMAAYFVPTQFWDDRKVCKSGGIEMKESFRYARTGNWTQAAEMWQNMYSGQSPASMKWRAAYNLAVYYETIGLLDEAEKLIGEAYAISGKRKVYKYQRIIDQRKMRLQQRRN